MRINDVVNSAQVGHVQGSSNPKELAKEKKIEELKEFAEPQTLSTGSAIPKSLINPESSINNTEQLVNVSENPMIINSILKQQIKELRSLAEDLQALNSIETLTDWDLQTKMPPKGAEIRAWQRGYLKKQYHEILTSSEIGNLIQALNNELMLKQLSLFDKALVRELTTQYNREKNIPSVLIQELTEVTTEAHYKWKEAKDTNNFELFVPYLEKIVSMKRQMAECIGYSGSPYNALLDYYESGMNTETLDALYLKLKHALVPIVQVIKNSPEQIDKSFLIRDYDCDKQMEVSKMVLDQIGFDLKRGRLDKSEHPFSMGISPNDVRLTTKIYKNNLFWAISTAAHEGGHGIYDQGFDPVFARTPLFDGASLSIHESQSKLYEINVGQSLPFWESFYPKLKEIFPEQLGNVSLEQFYKAINKVNITPIRLYADEVSYNLHLIIRYEIEKDLIEGKLEVKDVPKSWKQKTEEYLGVTPQNDAEGVLQDVHWSCGDIGYFPTYTLGTLYATQLYNSAKKEIPDLEDKIKSGNLIPLKEWLNEKVHKYARSKLPNEIIKDATGEPLNPDYFINYIKEKYSKIYSVTL